MSGLLRRLRPSNGRTADPVDPAGGAVPATAEPAATDGGADAAATDTAGDPAQEAAAVAAPAEAPTAETPATAPDAPTQVMQPAGSLWTTPAPVEATQVVPAMTTGDLPGDAPQPQPQPLPAAEADELVEERPLPAGVAPEDLIGDRPDTRRRSRLRRRVRHLRRVRELMLRDIGGLVYEIHRAGQEPAGEEHRQALVRGKLDRLVQLDAERLELEASLGLLRGTTVLREPGVGGACPVCSEYFASDATFCFRCGTRVDGRAQPAEAEAPVVAAAPPALEDPTPDVIAVPPPAEAPAATEAQPAATEAQPATAEARPMTADLEPTPPTEAQPAPAEVTPAEVAPTSAEAAPAEAEEPAPENTPANRNEATP